MKQYETKYRGRKPSYDRKTFDIFTAMIDQGQGATATAKETGVSRQTVIRIKKNRTAVENGLNKWFD